MYSCRAGLTVFLSASAGRADPLASRRHPHATHHRFHPVLKKPELRCLQRALNEGKIIIMRFLRIIMSLVLVITRIDQSASNLRECIMTWHSCDKFLPPLVAHTALLL